MFDVSGKGDYTGELVPDGKIAEAIQTNSTSPRPISYSLKHDLTLSKPKDPSSNKSDVFRRSVLILVFTGKQNLALSLKTFAIQSKSVRHQLLQLS